MSSTLAETPRDELSPISSDTRAEPALYIVLEGNRALAGGLRLGLANVDWVQIGRGEARKCTVDPRTRTATIEVPDPRISTRHARIVRKPSTWLIEDVGSTNGTFVEGSKVPRAEVTSEAIFTLGATVFVLDPAEPAFDGTPAVLDSSTLDKRPRGMRTIVPAVEQQMTRLTRVAASPLSVLLLGESGVGKEVLARTIHQLSREGLRRPFVAVNCGALAPSLVESQLFGYVKGAFSGAVRDEEGLVRASSGGTLFLDEIGELPATAQATLLRVLQEREVLPIGATRPVPVDLRVVAATLKRIDQSPSFRPDLYARVAGYVHRLPLLRDRRGDIGVLVAELLPKLAPERAASLRFDANLATALVQHGWPLNVRELESVLAVALVTSTTEVLRVEDIGDALRPSEAPPSEADIGAIKVRPARALTEEEVALKEVLLGELTKARGNVTSVAKALGKTRMQIHRWMKRFDIEPDSFRG